ARMKRQAGKRPLPGERPMGDELQRMIRVDHAGEFGAARIYDGQLAVFGPRHRVTPIIRKMKEQEQKHLQVFGRLVVEKGARPTALSPVWNVAGFALGAATALMGEKAAMACTAAVEEVINAHYQAQRDKLKAWGVEKDFEKTVGEFQADEVLHRDTAYAHGAKETPGYRTLSAAIKAGCRAAIWLSTRI
ncbi:MAG TPA: demethoxyubiquinone hydroxylase family protein, partial [Sphingomonadales bacterium]|nr:demethoxyubiquinone hydroxylase family protein [Sphingomonadales bacterium]